MMVIFLTGLVSMILMRTLRNDYAKYARENDDMETLVKLFLPIYYWHEPVSHGISLSENN